MQMYDLPDSSGHFRSVRRVFVAETLVHALDELRAAYESCRMDPAFIAEFEYELKHYVDARALSITPSAGRRCWAGRRFYLKREDLNHTGRTRSTTPWARRSSPGAWASPA